MGPVLKGAVDGVHGVVPVHARAKLLEKIPATLQDSIAYKKGQGPKQYGAETVYTVCSSVTHFGENQFLSFRSAPTRCAMANQGTDVLGPIPPLNRWVG